MAYQTFRISILEFRSNLKETWAEWLRAQLVNAGVCLEPKKDQYDTNEIPRVASPHRMYREPDTGDIIITQDTELAQSCNSIDDDES